VAVDCVEGVDAERVTAWLVDSVPGVRPPFSFRLIAGGHSNLTFGVSDAAGRHMVLRRPPLGHVLESAHDMAREHRIIAALADSHVPVAPALGLCEDRSVNGAPFYLMAFVDGLVVDDAAKAASLPAAERLCLGHDVADVLVALHGTDPDRVGLGSLGRKEAYLSRQLARWTKQWEAAKTHEVPEMDAARALLAERMPEQVGAAIVHGDFRLGNMLVAAGRVRAVLDWELCTLGDPLADVGFLLNDWVEPGESATSTAPSTAGGFPTRAELLARYAAGTGRDVAAIDYYRAFQHWRLAAIGQGVYKRYLVGAMGSGRDFDLAKHRDGVGQRAAAALELLETR
jgi:aminoglycoside phosphotransferase (APT) family kinase protein